MLQREQCSQHSLSMAINYHGRLAIDDNDKPVMGGTSSADDSTIVNSAYDPITRRLLVSGTGGSSNFVDNEVVAGSGTTFTLAATPVLGSQHVYANGQRLTPYGVDYTITGAVITMLTSWAAGTVLADYRF
jgi:hypothetical protein